MQKVPRNHCQCLNSYKTVSRYTWCSLQSRGHTHNPTMHCLRPRGSPISTARDLIVVDRQAGVIAYSAAIHNECGTFVNGRRHSFQRALRLMLATEVPLMAIPDPVLTERLISRNSFFSHPCDRQETHHTEVISPCTNLTATR